MPSSPVPGVRLGTVIRAASGAAESIRRLQPGGFESFQLAFALKREAMPPLETLAGPVQETGAVISALGVYGNPLRDDTAGEETRRALREAMTAAHRFGTGLIGCFAGRLPGHSIPDSVPRFREVWSELAREAEDRGVRFAFENCAQGGTWETGDWNMAHTPDAWELMFDAVPSPSLGLEWEPAHQRLQLIDPLPQLEAWAARIFHLHGKDAEIHPDIIRRHGVFGRERFGWHRLPGFGDTDWTEIMRRLRRAGFTGSIDIEGFHDPVYRGDRELEGWTASLNYLGECRDRAFAD